MIENATNLASIMNLAVQLERISSVYTHLKAFFLGSYIGNILLATLIGVTIMLFFFEYKIGRKQKHIERIQQEYGKLLKPDAVKLEYKRGDLKYSSEKDLDFEDFLNEVKKQKKYRKYKLDELCDAVGKAIEEDENSCIYSPQRITSVLSDLFEKEGLEFKFWIGEGDQPSEDYVEALFIQSPFRKFINGAPLEVGRSGDGRYTLKCNASRIAKVTSLDKIEKLKKLIEKLANNNEIKDAIEIYYNAWKDKNQALKEYNNKLAEIIWDLRMYPRGGFF
jgi:hypothetical protein